MLARLENTELAHSGGQAVKAGVQNFWAWKPWNTVMD